MSAYLKNLIENALSEDIGPGDITTEATIPEDATSTAEMLAKQDLVLAGLDVAGEVFHYLDPRVQFTPLAKDGDKIKAGTVLARVSGKTRVLLTGERVALNFLQHLSGIATLTAKYVEKLKGLKVEVLDTRKTLPGLRHLEKHAVRMGGGKNHRMGLYDMVLIKDNHIKAAGGITKAVEAARKKAGQLKIEVETRNLEEAREALAAKVDIIMLDNMPVETMREAVNLIAGRTLVEASGNVTLDTIRTIAETGVNFISTGSITHSAPAADISMKIK
ncbi:MAG: nicotinate-nucleotide diphosphorylase (carboxylating) [Nitrospirae bacterium RBG_19FT_COMBO_55_12]|nr:MAG: nicotinate-nucleotide diphosphorylase (carboxylating) [Nitrospirae bacterium RBG_19FT_COMBO_55_12]